MKLTLCIVFCAMSLAADARALQAQSKTERDEWETVRRATDSAYRRIRLHAPDPAAASAVRAIRARLAGLSVIPQARALNDNLADLMPCLDVSLTPPPPGGGVMTALPWRAPNIQDNEKLTLMEDVVRTVDSLAARRDSVMSVALAALAADVRAIRIEREEAGEQDRCEHRIEMLYLDYRLLAGQALSRTDERGWLDARLGTLIAARSGGDGGLGAIVDWALPRVTLSSVVTPMALGDARTRRLALETTTGANIRNVYVLPGVLWLGTRQARFGATTLIKVWRLAIGASVFDGELLVARLGVWGR